MSHAESETPQEPVATEPQAMAEYIVSVHTSSCKGAGTEGGVAVELHGRQASSGMQQLQPQAANSFARGQVSSPSTLVLLCTMLYALHSAYVPS